MHFTDPKFIELFRENINGFLWSVDFGDISNKMEFSDSVLKMTGYTPEELKNRPGQIFSIVHEDDRIEIEEKINSMKYIGSGNNSSVNFRIICVEGKEKWFNANLFQARNPVGEVTGIGGLVIDCSDTIEEIEKLKLQTKRLLELNSAKDKFISIVSHDLRAPFTSLLGFSEILLNEDLSIEDRTEYVNYIYEASNSQLQLINYLLDWSKLQSGRVQLEQQTLNVNHLVASCVASLTGNAVRKDITIITDIDEELEIYADTRLITQVITNLLSNALKFTPKEKKIYIFADKFKEDSVEIVVKDEGVGISPENQSKLFKIDQKLSMEGTSGEKGTGLGLTLVKEIVEKHNGNIWFYSEEGKGSEFHITIPAALNSVLIVEDDPSARILYRKIVEKTLPKYEIFESENGYDAMSKIINHMPSIVITDHEMPLMTGIHLAEAIRKKDKQAQIPIIVVSAKLDESLKSKYEVFNVNDFIIKPVEKDALIEKLLILAT